jgi:hypothetical protein
VRFSGFIGNRLRGDERKEGGGGQIKAIQIQEIAIGALRIGNEQIAARFRDEMPCF